MKHAELWSTYRNSFSSCMNGYSSIEVNVDIRDTYFVTEDASNPRLAVANILLSIPWSSFPVIQDML